MKESTKEAVATGLGGVSLLALLWCLLRRRHVPVRHMLGAFKCSKCGTAGADMAEMGFEGSAYVPPTRRLFGRERGEGFTRTEHFDKTSRGTN